MCITSTILLLLLFLYMLQILMNACLIHATSMQPAITLVVVLYALVLLVILEMGFSVQVRLSLKFVI